MDTVIKRGIDAVSKTAKTASKKVVQKTAVAPGKFIGDKIANKITSAGISKNKGKEQDNEANKMQEIYVSPAKPQQIIEDLLF